MHPRSSRCCGRPAGRRPGLMLRSLLSGEPALAEAAFVSLSDCAAKRVAALLRDRSGVGLRALCRKAGLPVSLEPAFAAAILALNAAASMPDSLRQGIDRELICAPCSSPARRMRAETQALMALLRRMDAEAAREEARVLADLLADDAALALLVEADPSFLVELEARRSARSGLKPRSVSELLAQDALVQAVAGIVQHDEIDACGRSRWRRRSTSSIWVWSATALTGRLSASSTSIVTLAWSGSSAPRQRRGRKAEIGVSASSGASSGRIGPLAERL